MAKYKSSHTPPVQSEKYQRTTNEDGYNMSHADRFYQQYDTQSHKNNA